MKIVWFSHTGDLGGAEQCLLEAITALSANGHSHHVVLPSRGGLSTRLEGMKIPFHTIPYVWWMSRPSGRSLLRRGKRLVQNLLVLRRLRHLLQQLQPDLVVTNTLTIPHGALSARLLKLPHVWYAHELFDEAGQGLFFDLGTPLSLRIMNHCSAKIMTVSRGVGRQMETHIPPTKLQVVRYGAVVPATPQRSAKSDGIFRLLLVGRITPAKRPEEAVRALALLLDKGLPIELTLLGNEDPPHGVFLRNLACELKINDRLIFLPFSDNPFTTMAAADLCLLCSTGEAFPRVTIEAMKLGKPVIGAASAGVLEQIRDGINGFLYEAGSPEDLAGKIEILHHDRALLHKMGEEAQEWADHECSPNQFAAHLEQVFQEATTPRTFQHP